jgi:hypothetical protein
MAQIDDLWGNSSNEELEIRNWKLETRKWRGQLPVSNFQFLAFPNFQFLPWDLSSLPSGLPALFAFRSRPDMLISMGLSARRHKHSDASS